MYCFMTLSLSVGAGTLAGSLPSLRTSGRQIDSSARFLSGRRVEPGFPRGRLEELDRVAGRVLDQDLLPADAGDDVVTEPDAVVAQPGHGGSQVADLDHEPVPAPGLRQRAVRHGLAAAWPAARDADRQAQVTEGQHGE